MSPESVHYKIFLCAAGYEPEIRRITIDKDICHNYFYLKQKILAIFPTLKDVAFTISWKDSEGDNIRICTDDELVIALKEMESHDFKKIYVNATPQGKEGPMHPDVICDGCEHPLHGFRYKCLVCYDYDLCPDCERSQMHPDHPMIRIPLPLSSEMPFGRRFARDIAKMGKHLERLLHQTTDPLGDKKAKGDYSSTSRSGMGENKKHKMKFCPHNDMHNFLHNLVYNQLEKMRDSSSGDNAASRSTADQPQPENSGPQDSSSRDCFPIFEEQKKFVNILTNGLNSFLDPLGIDIVVEEDPVKEGSAENQPQSNQSESDSGPSKTRLDGATSSSFAAPSSSQSGMTQTKASLITTDPVTPVAVDAPPSQSNIGLTTPLSNVTAPVSVASTPGIQPQSSTAIGVQPSSFTIGVPPPSSMIGSQSAAAVGVQPSPTIGFQLPPTIGVPPPAAIGVTPPVIGVQHPVKATAGAQVTVSGSGASIPVMTSPFVPNFDFAPQPIQVASSASSYHDDLPVLDSSWTVVNDGMGESMIFQPAASAPVPQQPAPVPQKPAPVPQQAAAASATPPSPNNQGAERIYPQLPTNSQLSTDEALKIMVQLGFKNEDWLRQLVEEKKGNIQEVLNFLSPIPKPKPSTNLLN